MDGKYFGFLAQMIYERHLNAAGGYAKDEIPDSLKLKLIDGDRALGNQME